MKARGEESMTVTVETTRGYEVMEMHLFDENASRERLPVSEDPLAAIRLAPSARGARPW